MSWAYPAKYRHTKPPKSKSGYRGVYFHRHCKKKKWKAYIRKHGQYQCLGYYATKEEAARVYNEFAIKIHGPGTFLNPV